MAQLRDSQTSQILHDGTPLECVVLAQKIGIDEVLYDDVGEHFDPDAVLKAAHENADGLEAAASAAEGEEAGQLLEAAKEAREQLRPRHLDSVRSSLEEVRQQHDKARGSQ